MDSGRDRDDLGNGEAPSTEELADNSARALRRVAGPKHRKADEESDSGHSAHAHVDKPKSILTAAASAMINFLLMFGLCCAYGIIMFEDPWNAKHRGLGVKMNLCSAMIMGLLLAVFSGVKVAIGGPDLNPIVFLGMFVQTIAEGVAEGQGLSVPTDRRRLLETCGALASFDPAEAWRRLGGSSSSAEFCMGSHLADYGPECDKYHDQLRATTIFAVTVSSLILGIIFFVCGRFKLTRFVSYVPTNIMEAFLACVGYKVFKYALKFSKYKPMQFIPAACVGVPLYFMKAMHLGNPAIVIPTVLFVPVGIFYTVVYAGGGSVESARASGWMFDEIENIEFWTVWTDGVGKASDINFKAFVKILPDLAIMIVVCTLDCMLKLSSTENKLPVKPDKNYEVQLYGLGNFITTLCGSPVGYMQLKFNVINYGVMGNPSDRRAGIIYACICGALFFWTTDLFNYLPRFFLSTLLFFAGSGFIVENLWGSRKYLSVAEWGQIIIIMAVFIFLNSLLYAVIVGGLITGATFIVRYAQIPCVSGPPMRGGEGASLERRDLLLQMKVQNVANCRMLVIRLKGYIFFASAQKLTGWVTQHIEAERKDGTPAYQWLRCLVFDCDQLDGLDSSASKAFGKLAAAAHKLDVRILWSAINSELVSQLKKCGTVTSDSQLYPSLEEARHSIEADIEDYIAEQQAKWVQLHPLFGLAHEMMRDRMAMEPFENILRPDMARLGCPWQYCGRLKIKAFSTVIWKAGERKKTLFLVHTGKVGMFTRIPSNMEGGGWEMPAALHGRGQLLNYEALVGERTRLHAVALEDGELLYWSESQWSRMAREHPAMSAAITQAAMRQEGQASQKAAASMSKRPLTLSPAKVLKEAEAEDAGDLELDSSQPQQYGREELRPWLQGVQVAKGLAELGLFDPPGGEEGPRTSPTLAERVGNDLATAFHTYKTAAATDAHPGLTDVDYVPADKVSEALLYAGVVAPALVAGVIPDLDEASFVALGQQLATASLSAKQEARLRGLFSEAAGLDGALDRSGVLGLLREAVHPEISVDEVDDLVSACAGASGQAVAEEGFLAVMARLVQRHMWHWCVLLGARRLFGSTEGEEPQNLPELLVRNAVGLTLTQAEAEELLWSADICSPADASLALPMVAALALWPSSAPAIALPPEPVRKRSKVATAPPKSGEAASTPRDGPQPPPLLDVRAAVAAAEEFGLPKRLFLHRAAPLEGNGDAGPRHSVASLPEEAAPGEKEERPATCRARMLLFLDYPESSSAASRWSVFMGLLIVISVITLVVQPLASPSDKEGMTSVERAVWENFERFFTGVFTLEFIVRFMVADALGNQTFVGFLKSPLNIADVVAVLPFYIDLAFDSSQEEFRLFRIARLMRLARLVRLGRLARRSAIMAPIAVIMVIIWGIFLKNNAL